MLTLAVMLLDLQARLKDMLRSTIRAQWNVEPPDIVLNQTPKIEFGELATPVSFELARTLKRPPRAIAEELIMRVGKTDDGELAQIIASNAVAGIGDPGSSVRLQNPSGITDPGYSNRAEIYKKLVALRDKYAELVRLVQQVTAMELGYKST